jgi:hypothetical protein
MKRSQLEHLIRAAGAIADSDGIVVIGSQAILATVPSPPPELVKSIEADVFPLRDPARSGLIDGAIGEGSQFHDTFGYYAQGVGPETAVLPSTWRSRLHEIGGPATHGVTGYCLDPHDLALSKYAAARPKDREFNRVLIRHGYVEQARLLELLAEMPLDTRRRAALAGQIEADFAAGVAEPGVRYGRRSTSRRRGRRRRPRP